MEAPGSRPLLVTIPHSGEAVPPEAAWLSGIAREVLLTDVDRFVDRLYAPALSSLGIPSVIASVHRYAVDLNRTPDDVDAASVEGALAPAGSHTQGFHWQKTTQGHVLMKAPIPMATHQKLVRGHHDPFHAEIERICRSWSAGGQRFHLDCHSMPSRGTGAHADAGSARPDVVLSDFEGRSSRQDFLQAISQAFAAEGLKVSINWPYKGGRITQRYGRPAQGHHTVQIELNRALYMDESTREVLEPSFGELSQKLVRVLQKAAAFVDQNA